MFIERQKEILKKIENNERIDLSNKKSFMFKNWDFNNSPILPIIQIEKNN